MGGFITGICLEIITMQLPKLYGGTPGTGELPELLLHIFHEFKAFNALSLLLGLSTIIIILFLRRIVPKLPMSIVMLVIGFILTTKLHIDQLGVKLLPETKSGLPLPKLLSLDIHIIPDLCFSALTIAIVIMAETILASRSNAIADGYDLDTSREVLAYSMANLVSAAFGCCPVNASVSRTSIVRQFGGHSQLMSVSACISMALILIFCTGFIPFLPVPVLTGIIVAALLSACEFHLAKRLWKMSRPDFIIFISAMLGVLFFGTVYGVVIGVILSFIAVIRQAVSPPEKLPRNPTGTRRASTHSKAHEDAEPIQGVIIYRFSGNLFFANIDTFVNELESEIDENTRVIIIYGSGINNVDITAADRLMALNKSLNKRGILFYIAENDGVVNAELERYGAGELITGGVIRKDMDEIMKIIRLRNRTH